jgi:TonB family protein
VRIPVAILLCSAGFTVLAVSDTAQVIEVGVKIFRSRAISAELPRYPSQSVSARHTGVVVCDVEVSEVGRVANTHILEAPDSAIASATETAIRQWTFRPFVAASGTKSFVTRSRVIVYFRLIDGRPQVIDAAADGVAQHRN